MVTCPAADGKLEAFQEKAFDVARLRLAGCVQSASLDAQQLCCCARARKRALARGHH
jgi:hypothetical protein